MKLKAEEVVLYSVTAVRSQIIFSRVKAIKNANSRTIMDQWEIGTDQTHTFLLLVTFTS